MNRHLEFVRHLDVSSVPSKTLKIGTDFSGIEAPLMALNILKSINSRLNYQQMFRCEVDQFCLESSDANYAKCTTYTDITRRNHQKLPKLDIYVAGFPCVSFSMLGKREGLEDPTGRGLYFFECVKTIKVTSPTVFILENVKGLTTHNRGETFEMIIDELRKIGKYHIYSQVLNTLDYGIRQNRERVYIIGIKKSHQTREFRFPLPFTRHLNNLEDYLESSSLATRPYDNLTSHKMELLSELLETGKIDSLKNNWFANLNVSSVTRSNPMKDVVPCLLAGEGSNCVYFLTSIGRKLTPREYLRFQGFPDQFKQIVSDSKMYKQVGNSMSVNVLCFLFEQIFQSVQFTH